VRSQQARHDQFKEIDMHHFDTETFEQRRARIIAEADALEWALRRKIAAEALEGADAYNEVMLAPIGAPEAEEWACAPKYWLTPERAEDDSDPRLRSAPPADVTSVQSVRRLGGGR
jgi:hypothetical protein